MVKLMQDLGMEKFKKEFSNSPKILAYLEANFTGASDQNVWTRLVEAADESDYSLRAWVESLIVMGHWLDARSQYLSLEEQIGYISCAGESAGAGSNFESLPGLVEVMLETYGCERASDRSES